MPLGFPPGRADSLGGAKHIAVSLLACTMLSPGCSSGATATGPLVSERAGNAARVETIARNADASYLYVADHANPSNAQVDVLLRKDLAKGIIREVSKRIEYPAGIFVDVSDNLYVANAVESSGHDTVTVYKAGSNQPFRTYRGIGCAADVLAGSDGTVYIADLCGGNVRKTMRAGGDRCIENGEVHVYAAGGTKQIRALHFKGGPSSLTLDDKNNLYVGYENACASAGQVRRYAPGAVKGVDLLPHDAVPFIGGIALDSGGQLLVVSTLRSVIDVFSAEHQPPSRVISTGQTFPGRIVFDKLQNLLYVTSPYLPDSHAEASPQRITPMGVKRPNTLVVIDYQSGKLLYTLKKLVSGWAPAGVAVFPPAPFAPQF
ncbi:MAG: hypothetical protein JO146_05055 [Candidatus Eremiobacteraeota bacterium]|nr:hypothetical protein [Candidatus Eremiobacteraeota bacterium]